MSRYLKMRTDRMRVELVCRKLLRFSICTCSREQDLIRMLLLMKRILGCITAVLDTGTHVEHVSRIRDE